MIGEDIPKIYFLLEWSLLSTTLSTSIYIKNNNTMLIKRLILEELSERMHPIIPFLPF